MNKKWIIILLILGILFGIGFGIFAYIRGNVSDTQPKNIQRLATDGDFNDEMMNNEIDEDNTIQNNTAIQTSTANTNISPNAVIIQKKYYKTCDHLIKDVIDIPQELVNKNEENVKNVYNDWKVESYSPTEITLYKEFDSICNEHYVVKEHNGVIGIYIKGTNGVENLQEDTQIEIQYLPEKDIENLKTGIELIGKTSLYNFLEDYE